MSQHVFEKDSSEELHFDIVIVGGGIVGLSFANELVNTGFSVAVIERGEPKVVTDEADCRVSAINRFALQRYQQTGVFSHSVNASLQQRICAYEKMFVWDQAAVGQIRFDSAELGVSELGAIIENNVLQRLLLERVKAAENIVYFCPEEITKIHYPLDGLSAEIRKEITKDTAAQEGVEQEGVGQDRVEKNWVEQKWAGQRDRNHNKTSHHGVQQNISATLKLSSGKKLYAKLLVGADGVNSKVRDVASIQLDRQPYQQQGLVCNVTTSESHQNTAWQCFMATGVLAFLPLYNGQCSIVWSLNNESAKLTMAMDDETFKQTLAEANEFKLGDILEVSQRFLFPLSHGHANEYVKPGLALIGDAAHNIHPLAGQGANLGIADAFALAETISAAQKAGRQWAALHTLKKYQRQRKGANGLMELSMTGFKALFVNDNTLLSELRNAGLTLLDHLPALKYRIIRQALGKSV